MSTSLGSNTYNRQNWEDAVSGGGGEGPGQPGRAGLGRRGPAAVLRERVWRQGRGGEENAASAAPGLGPSRGTRHLPCGPATCPGDLPPAWGRAVLPPGRALPRLPGPSLRRRGNKLLCRPFPRAAARGCGGSEPLRRCAG